MSGAEDSIRIAVGRRRRSAVKLSLTPLVDCVFILLIFFMLQSNLLVPHSLPLQPTQNEETSAVTAANERPTRLYIELQADGSAWLDGIEHDDSSLRTALVAADLAGVTSAIVASDPGVALQRAVDVIDVLNARGLVKVALREARTFK